MDSLADTDVLMARDVKRKLARLPQGINATDSAYDQCVQRIESQSHCERAKLAISWLTLCPWPIATSDLCRILSFKDGFVFVKKFDPENVPEIEDIVSICAGLLTVDHRSGYVRFVHYTAQEYFNRNISTFDPTARDKVKSIVVFHVKFQLLARSIHPL